MQYDKFLNDINIKEKYIDSVKSRFKELNENGNSQQDTLRESLVTSANEINPKKSKEWIIDSRHDEKVIKSMPGFDTNIGHLKKKFGPSEDKRCEGNEKCIELEIIMGPVTGSN